MKVLNYIVSISVLILTSPYPLLENGGGLALCSFANPGICGTI
jgi:hypothetical protein